MAFHYGQFCPVAKAAEVLGERWTILIIRELLQGTSRYSDFQRALSQISPTLLTKRLNQLVECRLVARRMSGGRSHAEYFLTAAGEELRPVVLSLGEWGMKWARGEMRDDELDVQLLMHEYCRRIDAAHLPARRVIIAFVFPRLPKFAHWWIIIDGNRERELCVDNPGSPADVVVRTEVRTMVEIWAGDTVVQAARRNGRLEVSGDPGLVRDLPLWLRPGRTAHIRPRPDGVLT
jgi:DNA-binding HxlR family transcriptional regulator